MCGRRNPWTRERAGLTVVGSATKQRLLETRLSIFYRNPREGPAKGLFHFSPISFRDRSKVLDSPEPQSWGQWRACDSLATMATRKPQQGGNSTPRCPPRVPTTTCTTAIPSFRRPHVTDYQQIPLFIITVPRKCDLHELVAAWEELGSGWPLRFPRNESCTTWGEFAASQAA